MRLKYHPQLGYAWKYDDTGMLASPIFETEQEALDWVKHTFGEVIDTVQVRFEP